MTKIKILMLAAAMLAGSTITNLVAAPAANPAAKKDIAIQLYSVRDDIKKDYAGTIKKVGEMGYTAVEAAGYSNGKFYGRTPEEFKKDIEAAGMRVLSSHLVKLPSAEEIKSKDFTETLNWWKQCIADHKAAGMEYIVVPWMQTPKTLADLKTYCDFFNKVGELCNAQGLKFGYHNHAFEFGKIENKDVMLEYMLKNTDPDKVFFELDVYWVVKGGAAPVELFKKYPNRFKLLHIKDEKELGQSGMVGFDAIYNNAKLAGAKAMVVEVERYDNKPLESVKMSLDYLNNAPFVKKSYSDKKSCCAGH